MKTNYIDISPSFTIHPISGDVAIIKDEDAVKQAIKNILWTNLREKPYKPKYGGNLRKYLFGKINFLEKEVLKQNITDLLKLYEPRIIDINVEVQTNSQNQTVLIDLYYTIISIPERQELNVTLQRIR